MDFETQGKVKILSWIEFPGAEAERELHQVVFIETLWGCGQVEADGLEAKLSKMCCHLFSLARFPEEAMNSIKDQVQREEKWLAFCTSESGSQ